CDSKAMRTWLVPEGKLQVTIPKAGGTNLRFNGAIIEGDWEFKRCFWDAAEGKELPVAKRDVFSYSGVRSPDGKWVAENTERQFGDSKYTQACLIVLDGRTHTDRHNPRGSWFISGVAFRSDSRVVAYCSNPQIEKLRIGWTTTLLDVASGQTRTILREHLEAKTLLFSPDGRLLASENGVWYVGEEQELT